MQSGKDGIRLTRRQFVAAGAMGGAALAVGCTARSHGGWEFLSDGQALTLAAICDRIVPADDFPSASASRSRHLHRPPTRPDTTGAIGMLTGTGWSRPMR